MCSSDLELTMEDHEGPHREDAHIPMKSWHAPVAPVVPANLGALGALEAILCRVLRGHTQERHAYERHAYERHAFMRYIYENL